MANSLLKMALAASIATCGACAKTVPFAPRLLPCTQAEAVRTDTVYFVNVIPPKISTILYECP